MTLLKIWQFWRKFWFEPVSPLPLCLYRICFGWCILEGTISQMYPAMNFWFGQHAITTLDAVNRYFWSQDPTLDILILFPQTEHGIAIFFAIYIAAAVCLTVGLFTRLSAIIVCLGTISMHHYQPYNINGGDSFLRLVSIFLCFSNCGAMLSLDRVLERLQVYPLAEPVLNPWAQRMIQVQQAFAYWNTFCWKIVGPQWLDGTAVYYATRLDDMYKYNLPILLNQLWIVKLLTWGTLVIEFAMWTFVWVPELRYFVLLGAAALHLGIDTTINLPVFEWAFIMCLINFVPPEDLVRAHNFAKSMIAKIFGEPAKLNYDPSFIPEAHLASIISSLDIFGRITPVGSTTEPNISKAGVRLSNLSLQTKSGTLSGYRLLLWLSLRLPLLWPAMPIVFLFSPIAGPQVLTALSTWWTSNREMPAVPT